jgi:hypothetical protein
LSQVIAIIRIIIFKFKPKLNNMKKLLLVAMLGILSHVASANNVVQINNSLSTCKGAIVTVKFVEYDIPTCVNNGYSPAYPATTGATYDLDNPATWAPTILQSYQTYSAIICIQCPGISQPFCLPPIGIGPVPPCDPVQIPSTQTPCCGTIGADVQTGGGGGICFTLDIHP